MATAAAASAGTTVAPAKKPAKPIPPPNSDFYQLEDVLTADEKAIVKKVRDYMDTKVAADHQQILVDDAFPFELLPSFKELQIGGLGYRGLWLRWRKPEAVRLPSDGVGSRRCVFLHLLRRTHRPGHGLDLSRRIGGAEAEVASADGALGKDRLLRPDRAAGGLGNQRRPYDDRQARGRHLDPQRPEAVDRQRDLVRRVDHLGARSSTTTRSRASSSRTRRRPASASRRSRTRWPSRWSRTARSP